MEITTKYGAIELSKEDLVKTEDGTGYIINHDKLIKIADSKGLLSKITTELDYADWKSNICYQIIYRAVLVDGDSRYEAVGEANDSNMATNIGKSYPATMAHKRAFDRVIIMALGLEERVYSTAEFKELPKTKPIDDADMPPVTTSVSANAPAPAAKAEGAASRKTNTKASENKPAANVKNTEDSAPQKTEPTSEFASVEEAKAVIVEFGAYKGKGVTIGELKEKDPGAYDWILNKYNFSVKGDRPNDKTKRAAIYIEKCSA